jgi:exopolysaccharide biosynthesis polyprenyl glycosylphosphotransferase
VKVTSAIELPRRRSPAVPRLALSVLLPLSDISGLIIALVLARQVTWLGWTYVAASLVVMRILGLHAPRISPRLGDCWWTLIGALAGSLVAVALLAPSPAEAGRFLVLGLFAAAAVIPLRGLAFAVMRLARARGEIREPTLILGAGDVARTVATTLQDHPEYGLIPVGFVDDVDDPTLPLPLLGELDSLDRVVREYSVKRVIVAFGVAQEPRVVDAIRTCDELPVEIHLVPRFFELGVSAHGPFKDEVWGIPLIRLRRGALRTVAWRTKRVFDVVVGAALLFLTAPLFLLTAVAVKLSGPGPLFFRQTRIGQRNEVFQVLKFRTMELNEDSDTEWTVRDDERVTRVGQFIRRTSLDELPQLINVLRGHMSLIGPRPERPFFVDRFTSQVARYEARHRVPTGITGWAQVHGLRGDTSIPERVRFDNYYIEHWSLWADLVILARTIWVILTGRH